MSIFYVNGEFVDEADAALPVRDLSILRGYGTFDFLRTYNGQPFHLMRNVRRLRRSCELIELALPWDDDDLHAIIMETLEKNRADSDEFNIRVVVTGGISPDNITPQGDPSLLVMVQPLHALPDEWYTSGVKVCTVQMERLIPGAKSINYIPAILAQKKAKAQGGIEALYRTPDDFVTEGTTTNLFGIYRDETIVTPKTQLLPGITRETVIAITKPHYAVEIRDMPYATLLKADEVFITAANKRIVPVVQIDDTVIGDGTVGDQTKRIMQLFDDVTFGEAITEKA